MASIDAELHCITRFLADAAVDLSYLGSKDEFFFEELERKVNGIRAELGGMLERVRRELPPDEPAAGGADLDTAAVANGYVDDPTRGWRA